MRIEIYHRYSEKVNSEKIALAKLQPNDWLRFEKSAIIIELPEDSHREEMWLSPYKMGQCLVRTIAWADTPEKPCTNTNMPISGTDINNLRRVRAIVTDPDIWAKFGCRWWQSPKNLYLNEANEMRASRLLEISDKGPYKKAWPINKALARYLPMLEWSEAKISAGLTADERQVLSRVASHLR